MGVVRADETALGTGGNRDRKTSLTAEGKEQVRWLFDHADLPPNVLLHLPEYVADEIMGETSGAARVNALLRLAQGQLISRTAIETVAQQKDPMKRLRKNGGARSALGAEGIVIFGQYEAHGDVAEAFDLPRPGQGECVSTRLIPTDSSIGVPIGHRRWRIANADDPAVQAPELPSV